MTKHLAVRLDQDRETSTTRGPKVVGVETVDHPTDKQLAGYAKSYFKRVDGME